MTLTRLLFPVLLTTAGCVYKVQIRSLPSPAIIDLPDGSRVVTPDVVPIRWRPFRHDVATVSASGYRPLEFDLQKLRLQTGGLFSSRKGEVELQLVPTHGPAGTWSTDDLP